MPPKSLCTVTILGLALMFGLLGCSGGRSGPIIPGITGTDEEITQGYSDKSSGSALYTANHYLWGLFFMHVNDDHTQVVAEPVRTANFHLNCVGYLENPTQLLKITNVTWTDYGTLLVDIQLIHPFKNKPSLTGFDVRGIAILDGIKLFPSTIIARDVKGDPVQVLASRYLLNADGYTSLWNRDTAQQVFHPKIFGYIKGKLATHDEYYIDGNLHGYKAYWTDPIRRVFESNKAATRTYEFNFPKGPLSFAYAVDVSWEPALNLPVTNIWNDFALSANSAEPYQISASIIANSLTKIGGSATVQFDVFDWQDATNFSNITVEAPDLFYGALSPGAPIGYPTSNSARYQVVITNTKGDAVTAGGGSDLLIAVEDVDNSVVTPDLTAYHIFKLPVQDVKGFWRDRNGNGSFTNVPLKAPLIEPSSGATGIPDLAVVSKPQAPYAIFGGQPEIMLFDDNDSRFIVYNRLLTSTSVKSGYPFGSSPPSWLLDPVAIDATNKGWFGVASTNNTLVTGNYRVFNLANIFKRDGVYGYSWHTGTDDGTPNAFLEKCRDLTAGMGNVVGDPIYALFVYDSTGAVPTRASVLSIGDPYVDKFVSNTFRTWIPLSTGYSPGAINMDAPILKCAIDTQPVGLSPLHYAFYVIESDPAGPTSEIEGFDINFMNLNPAPLWTVKNADIQAEFPGAYILDCEVVPSLTNNIVLIGDQKAKYNWLCVLMRDAGRYWLAFYDPLNPNPDNPGNVVTRSIYTSNKVPISLGGPEPIAIDVDHTYFEVYVLLKDAANVFYMSVFEFFY